MLAVGLEPAECETYRSTEKAIDPRLMHRYCRLALVGVIVIRMGLEKIWVKQCRATKGIRRRFGAKSALDYLIGEKLVMFAREAEHQPKFATELPRFLAGVWQVFNQYELAGYVASQKPATRKQLRGLLYLN